MSKQDKSSKLKKIAIGGAVAAAAGYVAGLLTAPQSGKETREDISSAAHKGMSEAERELKKLHTDLGSVIDDAKVAGASVSQKTQKELDVLLEKAKDAKEKSREILSAFHEGEIDDKDLKKAIKDANNAIDHIREYLKK
jgi:gas vesicle protein